MNTETVKLVYFVGAGDISMGTLVRYFLSKGKVVARYDHTSTSSVEDPTAEGTQIHHEENIRLIPEACKDKKSALVALTPATLQEHGELAYLRNNGFEIQKRAQVLGVIIHSSKGLCVVGAHSKTTTSTMTTHLFYQSYVECIAFLGGISKNYGTNLLLSWKGPYTVTEADEFDRPSHWLSPYMPVIIATDPDHLDVYGTEKAYLESFEHYTTLIQPDGALTIRKGVLLQPKVQVGIRVYTYSRGEGDFHAESTCTGNGEIFIDFVVPGTRINNIQLGAPVSINIENGTATTALAYLNRVTDEEIRQRMNSFRGVDRRFDFKTKNDQIVFLSDYAHHPSEIKQGVLPIHEFYKDKKVIAAFQSYLHTRTRDLYQDFADSLSLPDEVILVDIYPACETPALGVASKPIYDNLCPGIEKSMCKKEEILSILRDKNIEILITLGAGDIDNYAPEIKKESEKMKSEGRRTKN